MKVNLLPSSGKAVWQNNKAFIWFFLSLLLIYSVLKIIFYNYNYHALFTGAEPGDQMVARARLVKWSLIYDSLSILAINAVLLLLLQAGRLSDPKISKRIILPLFVMVNSFALLLNLADIFYFRFHFQRADADLLYVLAHPFKQLFQQGILVIIAFIAAILITIALVWRLHIKFYRSFAGGSYGGLITVVLLLGIGLAIIFKNSFSRVLVPAYPLVEIKSGELPIVQNSFHTFFYSVFRSGGKLKEKKYFSSFKCDSIFPLQKLVAGNSVKKNVVLFIMESVPYDFFDTASPYKVQMPFFDSLLEKSTFYNNAFAFSHESNKGITAILAGIPTLTDIPFYHSSYVNMPVTMIGTALKKSDYSSFFCIGDDYDNFGFAKCMNWLGIEKYYSREDIPGHKTKPQHSMGLQDEVVLPFMLEKIREQKNPFLAINYNISTHYPYDLPAGFQTRFPKEYTDPMKSMGYYDDCLQKFFNAAAKEPWFANTVFIFCSDHWLVPDDNKIKFNAISGYRVPIIIYDASKNEKKVNNQVVSQFDIPGTILAAAGYQGTMISYGANLFDSSSIKNLAFSKPNSSVYQVIDTSYVLGFNIVNDRAEYLYNYKKDMELSANLVTDKNSSAVLNALTIQAKAFIQKATSHYLNRLAR